MPHESTTEHEHMEFEEDEEKLAQTRNRSRSIPVDNFSQPPRDSKTARTLSLVAETPLKITHHHDADEDDDDKSGIAAAEDVGA